MYNHKKVTLVIPCYNEARGIEEMFQNKPSFIDEVIVVDNNSDDNTADVAKQYGASVLFLKKRGYGLACREGLLRAKGDIIIMMDGDNSYPLSEAEKFLIHIETKGCDFLSGARFPLTDTKAMPLVKILSNSFISCLIRRFFGINLIDSQSGMLIFKSCLLKEILPSNPDMAFSQAIKLKAWLNPSIQCGELHIGYYVRKGGRSKFRPLRDGMSVLCDILFFAIQGNKNKSS